MKFLGVYVTDDRTIELTDESPREDLVFVLERLIAEMGARRGRLYSDYRDTEPQWEGAGLPTPQNEGQK